MKTVKYDVIVHKAALPLQDGESIGQYTSKLRGALSEHVMKKLNLTAKSASVYMVECYGDSCVVDVYRRAPDDNSPGKYNYYAVKYTRKDNGSFDFSETTEVKPVTTYQPTSDAVTKAADEDVEKAQWTAAFINNLPDAAFAYIAPGGKKDAEGKTEPRSLRFLPHHDGSVKSGTENGSVDLAHLRNALARLDQANIPAAAKSAAKAHLQAHAKELLPSANTKKELLPGWDAVETNKSIWNGLI